jgi:hypothetical protein
VEPIAAYSPSARTLDRSNQEGLRAVRGGFYGAANDLEFCGWQETRSQRQIQLREEKRSARASAGSCSFRLLCQHLRESNPVHESFASLLELKKRAIHAAEAEFGFLDDVSALTARNAAAIGDQSQLEDGEVHL